MLLLRMTIGGRAPLGSVLEPAEGWAHRKAALPSAFIGWAVCVQEVLASASGYKKKNISYECK